MVPLTLFGLILVPLQSPVLNCANVGAKKSAVGDNLVDNLTCLAPQDVAALASIE